LGSLDVTVVKTAVLVPPILARFWRDQGGAVAVAVAILLPVLIGFAGIGVEVGLWFAVQRQNQSAADAAAISAALEYAARIQSGVTTDPAAAATTTAGYNLFRNANCSTSGTTNCILYPCYGFTVGSSCNTSNSNGALNAVQVALTQPLNTTFANLVTAVWGPSVNTVNVTTTAIASFPVSGTACLLALQQTGTGITLAGEYRLTMPNCDIAADSNANTPPSISNAGDGCIQAHSLVSPGEYSFTGDSLSPCTANGYDLTSPPRFKSIANPYATILTHAFLTADMPATMCKPPPPGAQIYTYQDGNCKIVGGLSFTGTISLSPGTYWVTDGSLNLSGTLECTSCSPGGPGVTIIFTTANGSGGTIGTLQVLPGGSLTITLNAPSSGVNAGLLMVQDTVVGATYIGSGAIGSGGSTLSGLIYFPITNLSLLGNIQTGASNCLVVVASGFSLTGAIGLDDSGCQTAGLSTVPTIFSVFLAV
jgi:Flp pilus assembly protein TadG